MKTGSFLLNFFFLNKDVLAGHILNSLPVMKMNSKQGSKSDYSICDRMLVN